MDNKKERAEAAGSEPYGYRSNKPIRIASEVSVDIDAPAVSISCSSLTINAGSVNITGDVSISGSLTVNGVPVL